ncbi:unnamed protein product [Polarella glacialis]|uniref:SET domain-containing protein n=1 Tax=Polarella glacialis TaxID=89957 RepID=A0A813ES49_POLGL|nr:unnamed protein product [Polarella glacialis]
MAAFSETSASALFAVELSQRYGSEGLIAKQAILPGSRILSEPPLVRLPHPAEGDYTLSMMHKHLDGEVKDRLLQNCQGHSLCHGTAESQHLLDYQKWTALALERQTQALEAEKANGVPDSESKVKIRTFDQSVLDAMLVVCFNSFLSQPTNCFQLVYPTISKSNHSCVPNAQVNAPDEGDGEIVCIKPIQPGEEITVSYLCDANLAQSIGRRQKMLAGNWEFTCGCPRCSTLQDDARAFSCPVPECPGRCMISGNCPGDSDELADLVGSCGHCGTAPGYDAVEAWLTSEKEVEGMVDELPEGLFKAWAPCNDFAAEHPSHWLSGHWKQHLATHTRDEAHEAESEEEKQALFVEAEEHCAAALRCVQGMLGPARRGSEGRLRSWLCPLTKSPAAESTIASEL